MQKKVDPSSRGTFVDEFLERFDKSELVRSVGNAVADKLVALYKKTEGAYDIETRKGFVDGIPTVPLVEEVLEDVFEVFSKNIDAFPAELRDDLAFHTEVSVYVSKAFGIWSG